MVKLDARNDDFIGMLLDVRGRVRAADIHGVNERDAAELLEAYRSEHPERSLAIEDGVLAPASMAQPAYAGDAVTEYQPPAPTDPEPAPYQAPAAPESAYMPDFATGPVPASPQTQAELESSPFFADSASAASPEAALYQDDAAEMNAFDAGTTPGEPPVAWYWWLVPFFMSWLGGLIAWLVLREAQPSGAKKLLIFGIVMTVIPIILGILSVVLGLGAFMAVG